jgi:hypothetical protein
MYAQRRAKVGVMGRFRFDSPAPPPYLCPAMLSRTRLVPSGFIEPCLPSNRRAPAGGTQLGARDFETPSADRRPGRRRCRRAGAPPYRTSSPADSACLLSSSRLVICALTGG